MKRLLLSSKVICSTRQHAWTWIFPAIALFFGSVAMRAAETARDPKDLLAPKRTTVPKLQGELRIDGELSEAVWKRAATLKPFFKNDGSAPGREETEVRVWYDDQALYLGWV